MSIRLRRVNGTLIACCAARSIPKDGDIYLDDEVHHALAAKFAADFEVGGDDPVHETLREAEESNNPNREWWDKEYGKVAATADAGETWTERMARSRVDRDPREHAAQRAGAGEDLRATMRRLGTEDTSPGASAGRAYMEHAGEPTGGTPRGEKPDRKWFSLSEVAARRVPVVLEENGERWEIVGDHGDGVFVCRRAPQSEDVEALDREIMAQVLHEARGEPVSVTEINRLFVALRTAESRGRELDNNHPEYIRGVNDGFAMAEAQAFKFEFELGQDNPSEAP